MGQPDCTLGRAHRNPVEAVVIDLPHPALQRKALSWRRPMVAASSPAIASVKRVVVAVIRTTFAIRARTISRT